MLFIMLDAICFIFGFFCGLYMADEFIRPKARPGYQPTGGHPAPKGRLPNNPPTCGSSANKGKL